MKPAAGPKPAGKLHVAASLGRADLLRALAALGELGPLAPGRERELAAAMHFGVQERDDLRLELAPRAVRSAQDAPPGTQASGQLAAPLPPLAPALDGLLAPLFGIVRVEPIQTEKPQTEELAPLQLAEMQPRHRQRLPFQPLLADARLATRMRGALAQHEPGRALDIRRAVAQLACAHVPARWPHRVWPHAPAQVHVLVDRSAHLRPYWADQDQTVYLLAQWLGPVNLCTWTIQGDPWQITACWLRGQPQPRAVGHTWGLPAPAADSVVVLLTDMAALRQDGAEVANLPASPNADADGIDGPPPVVGTAIARWQAAVRHLGSRGAAVWLCPPCSAAALPTPVPVPLAWLPTQYERRAGRAQPAYSANAPNVAQASPLQDLLVLLACVRRIEPQLVRALRQLQPHLQREPGLEARLWSCTDVLEIGADVAVWRVDKVLAYRHRFKSLPADVQIGVMQILATHHAVRGRAIEVQEWLLWSSHVEPATAQRFAAEIKQAASWLQCFASVCGQGAAKPDWLAFVLQTQAAMGGDNDLMQRFADAFGPLWGLAHQEAVRRGQPPPSPGALPTERLHEWSQSAAPTPQRTYRLHQRGLQLVLLADAAPASLGTSHPVLSAAIGMPLQVSSLAVTPLSAGGQAASAPQFTHALANELAIGPALPGNAFAIHTGNMRLHLAEIVPPLPIRSDENNDNAATARAPGSLHLHLSERGRDQYGLYFDLELSGMRASKVAGGKKSKQAASHAFVPISQRMRYIDPGQFLMGSPANELERRDNEGPQHLVTISHGFWLADTTCTQALWQALMGNNPARFNESNGGSAAHPVETVSLLDVQTFLQKLSQLLPQTCLATLPTEAEWEYACRAASSTPFAFGANITPQQVNYDGCHPYGNGKKGICRQTTLAVKDLSVNVWGVHQIHGNVWEWCFDNYAAYAADKATDPGLSEVVSAGSRGGFCVVRGGSWYGDAQYARAACRGWFAPDTRSDDLGFRFVLRSRSQAKPGF